MNKRQLLRSVRGAINQCFDAHPEYLACDKLVVAKSLEKRIVGALTVYAAKAAQVRPGVEPADDGAG